MEFDSLPFIFVFLPLALAGFFLAVRAGRSVLLGYLILISFLFYGYWDYRYVPLLAASVLVNYGMGLLIQKKRQAGQSTTLSVIVGVGFNLIVLGYFKYAGFFLENSSYLTGGTLEWQELALPLGISFFTFQQIAFLVDIRNERLPRFEFAEYCAFVTFFPQLIAGPIVHFREVLPQFRAGRFLDTGARKVLGNLFVGTVIFSIGLFKKAVIADEFSLYADPVFTGAEAGQTIFFMEAWGAALAFTIQIYFDFSGYSDMAIGLARMFGIRLPENFFAPYQSRNIVEFWRRWHITLSTFLRDHIYIPMGGSRSGRMRGFLALAATMLLGGLWHGAAWTFVAWGALHGIYLIVCHGLGRVLPLQRIPGWPILSAILTFICVVFAWVLFRAESFEGAAQIWSGMTGYNGIVLPEAIESGLAPLQPVLNMFSVDFHAYTYWFGFDQWIHTVLILGVCFFLPPSQTLLRRYRPVIQYARRSIADTTAKAPRQMYPHIAVVAACGVLFFATWIPRSDGGTAISLAITAASLAVFACMPMIRWKNLAVRATASWSVWTALLFVLGVLFAYRGRGDAFIYFQF